MYWWGKYPQRCGVDTRNPVGQTPAIAWGRSPQGGVNTRRADVDILECGVDTRSPDQVLPKWGRYPQVLKPPVYKPRFAFLALFLRHPMEHFSQR